MLNPLYILKQNILWPFGFIFNLFKFIISLKRGHSEEAHIYFRKLKEEKEEQKDGWQCNVCNRMNRQDRIECRTCGTMRK